MYTLQGIISKSVNNATLQFDALSYEATNAANFNTTGYKAQRFENYIKGDGRVEGVARTNYSTGAMYNTGNTLDLAINGAGFFPVTAKNGTVAYTRDGSFSVNKDGYLVTSDGGVVGNGIKIPSNYEKLKINDKGEILLTEAIDQEPKKIGKIPVVNFINPEGLKSIEGNKLVPTNTSGAPFLVSSCDYVKQGSLERSNVSMSNTVSNVMILNASLISSVRILKVTDSMYQEAINLRQ